MNPYEFNLVPGGIQRVNFIPFLAPLVAGVGSLIGGAVSLGAGALGALTTGAGALAGGVASTAGYLGSTAIGAGGSILGGIGDLGLSIFETGAGVVSGAGTALFGGQATVPVMTGGEMGSLSQASAAGGLFGNLSLDTLANVATAGYGAYMTSEQMELAEKAIEAQRRAGYVVAAPGTTALAPTTSIAIPAAAIAAKKELDTKVMIKYAIIALIAYLLLKGF